jgi:asparagine N-glycosylation enzyme membrane subunit Stt3
MALFRRSSAPSEAPADEDESHADETGDGKDAPSDGGQTDAADSGEESGPHDEADDEVAAEEGDETEDHEEPSPPRPPILPRLAAIGGRARKWRGWTPTLLILIFLLAILLRSVFYWPAASPDYLPPGSYLLSGNDPDYHKRAIDHLDQTHQWLSWDPLQNFPQGGPNPNPPGFETSGLLLGYALSPLAGNTTTAVWWSSEIIGALWSSALVFPVFFVAREMFGRKAGLIGAFLIAIMAGNIERNVVGFSDHDGYLMFFIAVGFYFYIRAMAYTQNKVYVEHYRDLDSVTRGFLRFFREQRIAILYTLMASVMWGACALGWKGFPYVFAIVLIYYFFSIIIMRWFRHEDPFALSILTMIAFSVVFAMTLPYYYGMHFMHWYEIFYLIWAGAAVITLFFVPTRNLPWVLIILTLVVLVGTVYIGLNAFAPDIADTIFSGAGYFSRNKLYNTIAEAQPPDVSRLVSSYGYVTSLLALGGIGLMAFRLPRRYSNAYVLMLAWAAAAIYMALTAVRFMYNATPLFAILAGWILWGIIDKTQFSLKLYRDRWAKYVSWRKIRTVPIAHWAVAYFLVFMVLFPNFMQGLDAGIPFETKKQWDTAIYNFMPDLTDPFTIGGFHPLNDLHIFRPAPDAFDVNSSRLWYLGAFGTSFMNDYWAVSMKWLATQDRQLPEEKRPGFISWWDYGHWAMHVGEHPTAADNFQNGFEFAGNFIGASGEDAGNSLILARYLETVRGDPRIEKLARQYLGDDGWNQMMAYAADPTSYNDTIMANPQKYMKRDPPISPRNAFYIMTSALITDRVTPEDRIWWIRDIAEQTGWELRYFAVDVRMMPFSASQTGIFYAPIILADYDKNDFVQILCHLTNGRVIPCDAMTSREYRILSSTEIQYKPSFYKSMFTRAYLGYTSNDIPGGVYNGFPGIRASCTSGQTQTCLAGQPPMQGFNMTHWRLVQRTVYFNPNATDLANHTKDWKIITDQEADQYDGNTNVTVDRQFLGLGESSGTGVMYLKYYAGAWVNGTVRTAEGVPVPGARVTVYDDVQLSNPQWVGVPHGFVFADENGSFSALVPFGNVTLIASTGGNPDPFQLREQVEIGRLTIPVSDNQAMRIEEDANQDGSFDFNIEHDITAVPGSLKGRAYLDKDSTGSFSATNDQELAGASLQVNSTTANVSVVTAAGADGSFEILGMAPGLYSVNVTWGGHNWTALPSVRVNTNASTASDIVLKGAQVTGNATDELAAARANASVMLTDTQTGAVLSNLTDARGKFAFTNLLPGNYTLASGLVNATPFEQVIHLDPGAVLSYNFTAADTVSVSLRVYLDRNLDGNLSAGEEAANASVEVESAAGTYFNLTIVDSAGFASTRYPAGNYTLIADYHDPAGALFAGYGEVAAAEGANWTLPLLPAAHFNGTVFRDADNDSSRSSNTTAEPALSSSTVNFRSAATGQELKLVTRTDGMFDAVLPYGTYYVRVVLEKTGFDRAQVVYRTVTVDASTTHVDIGLNNGTRITGSVGFDADRSGTLSLIELIGGANLTFTQGAFVQTATTTADGSFTAWLTDGNWTVTARASGYLDNATVKLLDATIPQNNSVDLFVVAAPLQVKGRIGFDRNGNGNLTDDEGFAGVVVAFTAESGEGAYFNGTNATATTNSTGDYTLSLPVGHYAFNLTVDRGTGASSHRYEAFDVASGNALLHPLLLPSGAPTVLNFSMRELTHLQGILWFDANPDGVASTDERPAGGLVTLRGGPAPTTLTSAANGSFEGYVRSGTYTIEASANVGGSAARAFLSVNLTAPRNLGLVRLERETTLTVHAWNDENGNGIEDAGEEALTGPRITFTNVTQAGGDFQLGDAPVQILSGRTYAYLLDQRRSESLAPNQTQVTVLYHAEGNYTFVPGTTVFPLPLTRLVQVTGGFYYDRNGDGVYTPGNREEPLGAFIEFRNASAPAQVVLRQEVQPTGAYEAFLPVGNYTVTVDHAGFDTSNASWRINITKVPTPSNGFVLDLKLTAHDVELTGYTFLDLNRNGRLNAFEAGMQVPTLMLYNATNSSDARSLSVAPDGSFNVTLKPGTYNLYAVGTVNGTSVAGIAQATVDPVGGTAWTNVSLRQAFFVTGSTTYNNTTGQVLQVPPTNYTVTYGALAFALAQPAGTYNITLPDGSFAINASISTTEFDTPMNYTTLTTFSLDLDNVTRVLEFGKQRHYTVSFNYTEDTAQKTQGASVNYTALIRNTGNENATFDLAATPAQVPGGWTYQIGVDHVMVDIGAAGSPEFISVPQIMGIDNVTLQIGESREFWILINTSNQTRSGLNKLQLRATPRNVTGGEGGTVDFSLTTRQDFGLDIHPNVDAPTDVGAQTNYFVSVENKGNGVDRVRVTVLSLPQGYSATVDQGAPGSEMELQPFLSQRVTVTVKRDPSAARAAQGATFEVDAISLTEPNATARSATISIVYGDLRLGGATNSTRATEPGKGDLVDTTSLTTPGFESALAAIALVGVAAAVRGRGRKTQ